MDMTQASDGSEIDGAVAAQPHMRAHTTIGLSEDADGKWLDHLAAVYSQEHSLLSQALGVGALAGPVILAVLVNLPGHCPSATGDTCLSDRQFMILPLGPVMFVMLCTYLYFNSRVVGKYARRLERTLAPSTEPLAAPALSRLSSALYAGRHRRLVPLRRFFQALAYLVIAASVYSVIELLSRVESEGLRLTGYIVYVLIGLLYIGAFARGSSNRTFDDICLAAAADDVPALQTAGQREFVAFLLFPRLLSVLKFVDVLPVIALTLWGDLNRDTARPWVDAVLVLSLYELLLYQTRYLLNLLREDQNNASAIDDPRSGVSLPLSSRQQVVGALIAVTRVAAFVFFVVEFGGLSFRAAGLIVLAFLVALLSYEIPRDVSRGQSMQAGVFTEARPIAWTLFVAVGMGYALRAAVVMYVLAPKETFTQVGIGVVVSYWLAGSAVVAAGWAVELTGSMRARLSPVHEEHASPTSTLHPRVREKPHLLWAGRRVGLVEPGEVQWSQFTRAESQADAKPDLARAPAVLPWHVAIALASAVAVTLIGGPLSSSSVPWSLGSGAAVGMLVALFLDRHRSDPSPLRVASRWLCIVAAVAATVSIMRSAGAPRLLIAVALVAAPVLRMHGAEASTFSPLMQRAEWLRQKLAKAPVAVAHLVRRVIELLIGKPVVRAFYGDDTHNVQPANDPQVG